MRKPNQLQIDVANDPRRLGSVTASKVHDLLAKTKTGYAASRHRLMKEIVAQRITGKAKRSVTTPAMQRGIDLEPAAKTAYEVKTGRFIEDPDFTAHASIKNFGASPDGIVEVDA